MSRIAVLGAGAVGCYYGGRLAVAGHDVTFVMRSGAEAVRQSGFKVESVHGDFELSEVKVVTNPKEVGPVDLLIVAWKATANHQFEKVIPHLCSDDTEVLTLQNGLGNDALLANLIVPAKILGGLCFVCINRIAPTLIKHTASGRISLGSYLETSHPRAVYWAELFQRSGIECQAVPDLEAAQWRKLIWNIPFNGLAITMGGVDTATLLSSSAGEAQVRAVMKEIIMVNEKLGFGLPANLLEQQIETTRAMGRYLPSSLLDYLAGKPVELDAIWKIPQQVVRERGLKTPALDELIIELESLC